MDNHAEHEGHSVDVGKNRIEALSDGIFAVAMTLLVFEFHVPNLPHNAPNVTVLPAILGLWPKFVGYAVAFMSLGVFWVGHHNMYHAVRRADRTLLWLNILFYMMTAFLPFSTSVLNAFPDTQIGPLMFGANLALIGWLLFFQWLYAERRPGMLATGLSAKFRKLVRIRFLMYPLVVGATMLICFWSVPLSLIVYIALLPLYIIPAGGNDKEVAESTPPTVDEAERSTNRLMPRMKWVGTALVVTMLLVLWAAFRPELLLVNMRVHDRFPAMPGGGATVVDVGKFHGVAHETHGMATIYRFADGRDTLRLSGFTTANGPDVHVLLITAPDADDNATVNNSAPLEIAKMKGNVGDQNYELPPHVNLTAYHAVTLWCERFHVNFGTAPLTSIPAYE